MVIFRELAELFAIEKERRWLEDWKSNGRIEDYELNNVVWSKGRPVVYISIRLKKPAEQIKFDFQYDGDLKDLLEQMRAGV